MMSPSATIALITGANKGIGLATARQLGAKGIHVLVGARNVERGSTAVAALQEEGIVAEFIEIDLTKPETIQAAAQTIEQKYGKLDILVNNAGVALWHLVAPFEQLDLSVLRTIYETNVLGTVSVTQAMLPLIRRAEAGRIVNLTSRLGSFGTVTNPEGPYHELAMFGYPSSKTALNLFTLMLARELQGSSIKINAVCPGYVATDHNGGQGFLTAEQGAEIVVQFATVGTDGPNGGFFEQSGTLPW
jgi:NAD(P)-dependent dehydrogenase (short-subunit alcohol dehydrogenase family)